MSGPLSNWEFNEVPFTVAAASHTKRTFTGFFGLMTTFKGKYHTLRWFVSFISSVVAKCAYPFCKYSSICLQTLSYKTGDLDSRCSSCFILRKAICKLFGNCGSSFFHSSPVSNRSPYRCPAALPPADSNKTATLGSSNAYWLFSNRNISSLLTLS